MFGSGAFFDLCLKNSRFEGVNVQSIFACKWFGMM